ncbi:MAG: NADH-quinone oxidoreductase subunit N [Bacillota bacterium]
MAWAALAPELILTAASLVLLLLVTATRRPVPAAATSGAIAPGASARPAASGVETAWGGATAAIFAVALVALVPGLGTRAELWAGMLSLDPFAALFRGMFLAAGLLVALVSVDFLRQRAPARGEYWPLLLWGVLGMMLMASSRDLLMIYLGLELVSLCSYVLAGYLKEDARSVEAAIKYFLTGAVASAVLLFGISLLYGAAGSTSLDGIARAASGSVLGSAALAFLVVGFGFKVAGAPLHMWAPDAYEGAPTPITAFFSVGPKAAAFAALLRVFFAGLGDLRPAWTPAFAVLAVLSMFVGNLSALPQKNIKRMMAYSAIAHAGYILVGLAVGTPMGSRAVAYYLLAYLFANLGVFAVIVAVAARGEQIEDYTGLARRQPLLAWAMVIYFLSLIGIPPTAGFFGKFYLFSAALEQGEVWLALVIVVNSVISVGYYYGVVRQMFLASEADVATDGTRPAEPHHPEPASGGPSPAVPAAGPPLAGERSPADERVCPAVTAVVVVTAVLTMVIGLGFEYFLGWAAAATAILP